MSNSFQQSLKIARNEPATSAVQLHVRKASSYIASSQKSNQKNVKNFNVKSMCRGNGMYVVQWAFLQKLMEAKTRNIVLPTSSYLPTYLLPTYK